MLVPVPPIPATLIPCVRITMMTPSTAPAIQDLSWGVGVSTCLAVMQYFIMLLL